MSKPDDMEMLRLENDIWRMMSVRERNLREADIKRHMENEAKLMATIHDLQVQLEKLTQRADMIAVHYTAEDIRKAVLEEREACARLCEDERALWRRNDIRDTAAALGVVAAAIRARGGAE